jgi:SAM-dependent methyltransferase
MNMDTTKASVSREDIVAAYRMFLGREPSAEEIRPWLGLKSFGQLRSAFLSSAEFNANNKKPPQDKLPLNLQAEDIEWQTDPDTSSRLLEHVRRTWTAMGETKPHWSVLSSDQFLPESIAENERTFFASGENDLTALTSALERHGVSKCSHVFEYGCGIGRVTPYLARVFPRVTACDISTNHLMFARQVGGGLRNVTFRLVTDENFAMTEPFDVWASHIVLQHNPPPIIAMILKRMFKMLASGGIAIFQLPTYCIGYHFSITEYLNGGALDGVIEVHCLPQPVVFRLANDAGCIALEVREDDAMGPPSHWLSNTFIFRKLS